MVVCLNPNADDFDESVVRSLAFVTLTSTVQRKQAW